MTESERTHVQTKDIKLHPFYIYFTLLYKILTVFTYVYNWDNLENISLFGQFWKRCQRHNTTDPEYSVCIYNLSYLSSKIECHLHWLKFWPTCNAISIGSNFGHHVAPLESLALPQGFELPYWHYQLLSFGIFISQSHII